MPKKKKGQRADGKIEIKRVMPDGKARHFYGASRAECEAKHRAALVEWQQTQQAAQGGDLLADVAAAWWEQKQPTVRHGTALCYSPAVDKIKAELGSIAVKDLTAEDVSRFLYDLKARGLAAKTIANTHTVLNMVMEYAAVKYRLKSNPSKLVSTPTADKNRRLPPADDQIRTMLGVIGAQVAAGQVTDGGLMAAFYLYTGVRRGEGLALRWCDIDRTAGEIHIAGSVEHRGNRAFVGRTKTDNGIRTVVLLPQLAAVLDAYGWGTGDNYVFGGGPDPLSNRQFNNRWIDFCKTCGLVESKQVPRPDSKRTDGKTIQHTEYKALVTPHQLRHYFATVLYFAGVKMEVAVRMMGHADSEMIRRVYLDVNAAKLQDAGRQLYAYMSAGS